MLLTRQGRLDEARPLIDDVRTFLASGAQDEMIALLGAAVVELDTHRQPVRRGRDVGHDILERSGRGLVFCLAVLVAYGTAAQADRAELARAHHDRDAVAYARPRPPPGSTDSNTAPVPDGDTSLTARSTSTKPRPN